MGEKPKGTGKTREGWPSNVHEISIDQFSLMGIDPNTDELYWNGRKVKTELKLDLWVLVPAWIASLSTLAMALFMAVDVYLKIAALKG